MGFSLESEMIPVLHSWLSLQVDDVKREFRTPWGYCDLVGCSLNLLKARKRVKLQQTSQIGPIEMVDLLWQLPDEGSGSYSDLQKLMDCYSPWVSIDSLCGSLLELEKKHFVVRDGQGRLQKRNGWFPLHKRLVAVEAKLSRVDESIWQAAKHLAYANETYVALPASLAHKVSKSNRLLEFRSLGLGLLAVRNDSVRVLIKSRNKGEIDPVLQAHSVERFWRPRITNKTT